MSRSPRSASTCLPANVFFFRHGESEVCLYLCLKKKLKSKGFISSNVRWPLVKL